VTRRPVNTAELAERIRVLLLASDRADQRSGPWLRQLAADLVDLVVELEARRAGASEAESRRLTRDAQIRAAYKVLESAGTPKRERVALLRPRFPEISRTTLYEIVRPFPDDRRVGSKPA
jgi:hypothetical protein